jgi:PAS domain S-box-containing protein
MSAAILRSTTDGFCLLDCQGRILEVNDSYCRLVGYSREELLTMRVQNVEAQETDEEIARHIERVRRLGRDRFETRHRCKDGTIVDVDVSASFLDMDGGRFVTFFRDITERKRNERALRESEERLSLALQAARMGTWDWDIPSNRVTYSEELGPVFGMARGAHHATYEEFLLAVHPLDRDRVIEAVREAVEEGANYAIEFRMIVPDGSTRWIGSNGKVYRDISGKPVRMVGVAMNITDRKHAEEALRQSEQRTEAIVAALPDMVFRLNWDGTYKEYRGAEDQPYISPSEFLGRKVTEVLPPDVAALCMRSIEETLRTGRMQTFEYQLFVRGRLHPYEARVVPAGGDEVLTIVRDLSDRKRTES